MEAFCADENVWLSQKLTAQLYDVDVRTITITSPESDLRDSEVAVIQHFRITAADSKTYDTKAPQPPRHHLRRLQGRLRTRRAVRKCATRVVEEFTIKGFAIDDERLKRSGSILSDRYFEE